MFQPGEEGCDGAGHMIDEGVLDAAGRRSDAAYGLHVLSPACCRGLFAAAARPADGRGRRAARHGDRRRRPWLAPHEALDPVPVAAEMVTALQTMVTRQFDVFDPVVITVGEFHAGTRRNVIPETGRLRGDRAVASDADVRQWRTVASAFASSIAAAHGCTVEVGSTREYPVTVNDADAYGFAAGVAASVRRRSGVQPLANPLRARKTSRACWPRSGRFVFLGACRSDPDASRRTTPRASFDDGVLGDGPAAGRVGGAGPQRELNRRREPRHSAIPCRGGRCPRSDRPGVVHDGVAVEAQRLVQASGRRVERVAAGADVDHGDTPLPQPVQGRSADGSTHPSSAGVRVDGDQIPCRRPEPSAFTCQAT